MKKLKVRNNRFSESFGLGTLAWDLRLGLSGFGSQAWNLGLDAWGSKALNLPGEPAGRNWGNPPGRGALHAL